MQNFKSGPNARILILWSLYVWAFGYQTVWRRLDTKIEGTIVTSRDIPPSRGPRYATDYMVRGSDGETREYVAGPTDGSLPRNMPAGTYINKERWRLSFERNGQRVDDFSIDFYLIILVGSIGCLCWGLRRWHLPPT
jgi:hypothetical protein